MRGGIAPADLIRASPVLFGSGTVRGGSTWQVEQAGLDHLPCGPHRGWMLGQIEVKDSSPLGAQDKNTSSYTAVSNLEEPQQAGSYQQVTRRIGLDRRTVEAKVDSKLLRKLRVLTDEPSSP